MSVLVEVQTALATWTTRDGTDAQGGAAGCHGLARSRHLRERLEQLAAVAAYRKLVKVLDESYPDIHP